MELYDAMSTLRAVRRIKPDPIPEHVLDRVLTAATWAPLAVFLASVAHLLSVPD